MYVTRTLEAFVRTAADQFPVTLVTGARQVGNLLLVQDGMAYPLELKKTASPGKDDVRHFATLARLDVPLGPGGVICLAEQALPLTPSTWSIPAWLL